MQFKKLKSKHLFFVSLLILVAVFALGYRRKISGLFKPSTTAIHQNYPEASFFRQLNYQTQLDDIKSYAQVDPIQAWSYLKSAFLVNGQQVGNAHQLAHLVGNGMYTKYGLDGITNCDAAFAFGCFHGVTEKLLLDKGTDAILGIQNRCLEIFPPNKSQDYTGCIHGMGHGLFTFERFNVSKALGKCDTLDSLYENYCYDGVFMEHASDMPATEFDPAHPWQFCLDLAQKYHFNCARYQSQVFLGQFPNQVAKIGQSCAKAQDATLSNTCFESLGYYLTQTNLGKLAPILAGCRQVPGDGANHCIIGSTREVAFQAYPDWQTTTTKLCDALPSSWHDQCGLKTKFTPVN